MADSIPGQPGTPSQTTAVETSPIPPAATPAPAEVAATTDGAPGAAVTTQTSNPTAPDFASVDVGAMDAGAYKAFLEQLSGAPPGSPAEPVAQPDPTQTPEPEPTPAPEVDPATPAPEVAPPAEPVPEEAEDGPFGGKFRPRLGKLPKEQQEAIQLVREMAEAGTPIPLAEAEKRVLAKYGKDQPGAAPTPSEPVKPASEIEAAIKAKREEYQTAAKAADLESMARIQLEIEDSRDQLDASREAERRSARQTQTAIGTAKSEVHALFPDFTDPKSALSVKFTEIYDQLKADGDPIISSNPARQILTISKMAAAELGIKAVDPKAKATPPAPVPPKAPAPTAPTPPAQRPVQPASGSARTTAPANAAAQLTQQAQSLKSVDDYEAFKAKLAEAR